VNIYSVVFKWQIP